MFQAKGATLRVLWQKRNDKEASVSGAAGVGSKLEKEERTCPEGGGVGEG